jgi:hypothetical protein
VGTLLYWYNIPDQKGPLLLCKAHDPLNFFKKIATFGITSYYASSFSQKFCTDQDGFAKELLFSFITGFLFDGLNTQNKASFVQALGSAFVTFFFSQEYRFLSEQFYNENRYLVEENHGQCQRNLTEDVWWSDYSC